MDSRYGADKPAVGHIGESGEVGAMAAGRGDGAAALEPGLGLAGVGEGRVFWVNIDI